MTPFVVIDASVALKWVLDDEDEVEQAVALRDHAIQRGIVMVAPSLWLYEIANGLVTAVRRRRLLAEQGQSALHLLQRVGVRFADPPPAAIYALAIQNEIAAYDSAYLALATALEAPLWTGDRPFYARAGLRNPTVRWIGDFHG